MKTTDEIILWGAIMTVSAVRCIAVNLVLPIVAVVVAACTMEREAKLPKVPPLNAAPATMGREAKLPKVPPLDAAHAVVGAPKIKASDLGLIDNEMMDKVKWHLFMGELDADEVLKAVKELDPVAYEAATGSCDCPSIFGYSLTCR